MGDSRPTSPPRAARPLRHLSMMAPLGLASRPVSSRSAMTSAWLIFSSGHACRQSGEPSMDGPPRRKVPRQEPPRAARPQNLEDRIDDLSQRPALGPPGTHRLRQMRLQERPFRVRDIAFRSAGASGYARAGWSGSTSQLQKGFSNLLESGDPRPLNPFRDGLSGRQPDLRSGRHPDDGVGLGPHFAHPSLLPRRDAAQTLHDPRTLGILQQRGQSRSAQLRRRLGG